MVGIDGEVQTETEPTHEHEVSAVSSSEEFSAVVEEENFGTDTESSANEFEEMDAESGSFEASAVIDLGHVDELPLESASEEITEESFAADDEMMEAELLSEEIEVEEVGENYDEGFLSSHMDDEVEPPPEDPAKDPLGVMTFERSDASQTSDGPYHYDVCINGLDTAIIRQEVLRRLNDPRLGWSPEDLLRSLRQGELILKNLNPVKAVVTIINLQSLDVDVSWEQKHYAIDEATNPAVVTEGEETA